MIDSDKKIILGRDRTYTAGEEEGTLEGGIAIGDNGSDQVVIVEEDTNPYTLAHELSHAFRAIHGQRNEAETEINHDEEGHAILAENRIRYETGAALRTDGDSRIDIDGDGIPEGDGSYGQIEGELNLAKKSTSKKSSASKKSSSSKKSSGSSKSSSKSSSGKSTSKSSTSKSTSRGSTSTAKGSTSKSTTKSNSTSTTKGGGLVSAIKNKVSSAVTKVKTTAKQAVTKVKQTVKKVRTKVKQTVKTAKTTVRKTIKKITKKAQTKAKKQYEKKTHTEKVGASRSPKQMTKAAKKEQKKATKEAGKGFKDSFKDTAGSVKNVGKTLLNATGINGKQKKEQAVGKIYGITQGIGTTIAHPIRSAKEIASGIRKKAKEKGESYVGGYILGELTQTAAAAGVAAAAGKGLKGAKAAKKTKPKKSNGLVEVRSKGGLSIKKVDDIIDNLTETTNGKGVARNFESMGGFDQTIKDFNAFNPSDVKEIQTQYGLGKVGKLSDGTIVVARPGSTTGGATLEIRISNSKVYKIRY